MAEHTFDQDKFQPQMTQMIYLGGFVTLWTVTMAVSPHYGEVLAGLELVVPTYFYIVIARHVVTFAKSEKIVKSSGSCCRTCFEFKM